MMIIMFVKLKLNLKLIIKNVERYIIMICSKDVDQEEEQELIKYYYDHCLELSENFIREFQDKLDWSFICQDQRLSEEFIIEFKDKVNWKFVSGYQKLSLKFIKDNIDKLDIDFLLMNNNIHQSINQTRIKDI